MRGRPLVIPWQDDAATLYALYRQEPEAELRLRWHALWLLRDGHPLAETARLVGVHYVTLQQWLAWYRVGGLAALRQHRHGGRQGRAAHLTAPQQQALREQTAAGQFHTAAEARQWVAQQFAVHYTRKSIYTLLRRLRLHPKVPRPVALRADPSAQTAWKKGASRRR